MCVILCDEQESNTEESKLALQFNKVERLEEGQRNIGDFLQAKSPRSEASLLTPVEGADGKAYLDRAILDKKRARSPSAAVGEDANEYAKYSCPKCRHNIVLSPDVDVTSLKKEHYDWHYAVDLANGIESPIARPKARVRKKGGMDIRAFLRPR